MVLHCCLHQPRRVDFEGSHLHSVPAITSQRQDAVKLHGDFSPRWKTLDCSSRLWVHRALGGDSGEVVNPFMHVGTYPTRHLAHICYFPDLARKFEADLHFASLPTSLWGSDFILIARTAISGVKSLRILDTAVSPYDSSSSKGSLSSTNLHRSNVHVSPSRIRLH